MTGDKLENERWCTGSDNSVKYVYVYIMLTHTAIGLEGKEKLMHVYFAVKHFAHQASRGG